MAAIAGILAAQAGTNLLDKGISIGAGEALYQKHLQQNIALLNQDGLPSSYLLTNSSYRPPTFSSYLGPGGNQTPPSMYFPQAFRNISTVANKAGVADPGSRVTYAPTQSIRNANRGLIAFQSNGTALPGTVREYGDRRGFGYGTPSTVPIAFRATEPLSVPDRQLLQMAHRVSVRPAVQARPITWNKEAPVFVPRWV